MSEAKKTSNKKNFLKETVVELKKVVWPTKKQAAINTVIVIVASIITSLFIAGADFGFKQVVRGLFQIVNK